MLNQFGELGPTFKRKQHGMWIWQCESLSPVWLLLPMDCSSPGFSVHGISQARILEWVVIPFSRGSSQPRDQAWVSCIAGRFLTIWATTTWMNLKNIMLTEEWINKMRYIYTMEYYSAIKKNEIMSFEASWMDLESVILSKISQMAKEKYHMTSLKCRIWK